ncbi:class I SAM-dependent methyltransferase [Terasakiella sp. A23]|uniref:class I SAM-dependent DNA methyltransferase n=1 Tax=Terasakiella sp. FCG-A23 TaxID=3080561 RepID=UPI002955528C|nr:class I SAM-dependent methyltransferase [Terasakiella sp. A23]MDV7340470.1 class I SAM-dependent methyltransferase [Terasakiella sp. A23]
MADNEWDDYAQDWDGNPQTGLYAAKAFEELQKISPIKGLRIFDFGCGTGLLSEKMSPMANEIVALDGSAKMIDILNNKALSNVKTIADFLSADLLKAQSDLQNSFDLVVASSVCAFVPDYPATLKLLKSLLVEGGTFVQWDWLVSEGEMGFAAEELRSELQSASFSNIEITVPFQIEGRQVVMASAVHL